MSWNSTSFSKRQARTRATSTDVGDPNTLTGIFSSFSGSPVDLPQIKLLPKEAKKLCVESVADLVAMDGLYIRIQKQGRDQISE